MADTEAVSETRLEMHHGRMAFFLLSVFTAIGIGGSMLTGNDGTAMTWFWIGFGISVLYLLSVLVDEVQKINSKF